MKLLKRIVLTIIILAAVIYGGSYLSLLALGNYLTPSDTLQKSDAIVVFSGQDDRASWGIKLYQEGLAPIILFSGAAADKSGPSNAQAMRNLAINSGVPKSAILVEENSANTYENAFNSKQILDKIGAKKIILVTSPYHQRRSFEDLKMAYRGKEAVILNSPSGYSDWNSKDWWQRPASTDVTTSELLKLLWSKLTGEYT